MSNYIKVLPAASEGWTRPTEWLPIPSYTANEEVFYGLHAVWNTSVNPCALLCNGTGAGYTVDWGDGTVTNYAFNVKAERNYNYASLSGTPFRGYRQALVKVTPRSGAVINHLSFRQQHSSYTYPYVTGWLEIISNFSNITLGTFHNIVYPSFLERIYLKKVIGDMSYFGSFPYRLEEIEIGDFTTTDCNNFISNATNLKKLIVPPAKMALVTNFSFSFFGCPDLDLSMYTLNSMTLSAMFNGNNSENYPTVPNPTITDLSINFFRGFRGTIIPAVNCNNVTTFGNGNWLWDVPNRTIRRALIYGFKVSISIANQLFDKEAIIELANNAGTANAGAVVTITGNPGSTAFMADPVAVAIFTGKGWTITN